MFVETQNDLAIMHHRLTGKRHISCTGHINMQDFVPLSLVCNNIIGINDTFTDNKSLRDDRCRSASRRLFSEMWFSHIRPDRYLHRMVAVNIGAALTIILFRIRQNRNTPVQIARP
nr:MAG TPA: hypothetical protein [Bacteriophage sp.]